MKKYFRVYGVLLKLNFGALTAYRVNFINSFISSVSWGIFTFIIILLLTARTSSIYGWSRDELLILTGAFNIVISVFHLFFTSNLERFTTTVHQGRLDGYLLKPIDPQFLLTMWNIRYMHLFRILMGLVVTVYVVNRAHIAVQPIQIVSFILLLVLSVLVLYCVWMLFLIPTIRFTELYNMSDLLSTLNNLTRYPPEITTTAKNVFIYFLLPFSIVVSTPTKMLLHKVLVGDVILLFFSAVILCIVSRLFWIYMLRFYSSASG